MEVRLTHSITVNWFTKLPGFRRSPAGLEWALWKRLPAAFGWGIALPTIAGLCYWLYLPADRGWAADGHAMLMIYQLIGLVVFIWSLLLAVAVGCVIVMVMKGPAYVADAYPHPEHDTAGRDEWWNRR